MSTPPPSTPPAPTSASDLLDQRPADWTAQPDAAFDAWLATQEFRRSSADVYRAQWGAFLAWLGERRQDLATVDTQSIALFVGELPIKKTQRIRYLRLIERVLDHVRRSEYGSTNPARFIAQDGEASWRSARDNDPTGFLAPVERAALLACLFSPLPAGGSAHWKERRDRALVAAFLGAGLKTGEARSLTISCIKADATTLTVHASQPDSVRETHVSSFAIALFDAWLAERRRSRIPGDLVFPASLSGRPMHKATMLRASTPSSKRPTSPRHAAREPVRKPCATPMQPSCSRTGSIRSGSAAGSDSCSPFHRTACIEPGRTGRRSDTMRARYRKKCTPQSPAAPESGYF